ncbi:NDUFAF2 [Branchiostoma lanceolatum]|uniref:NDUFAF2 protein n=1 Tax=Branchiostoma lanceolatum TaxID=7740 RepID=A0A8K0EBU5_BRALA|nr:NDUFAF2 [Branchiostoma lanceolatum]
MFNRIRALIGPAKRFVGADHLGNKYYEIPERTTILAWIRGRRKDPPTDTEIEKNEKMMRLKQQRGKEAEEKDMARQQQEYDEGLVARPAPKVHTGHASSPSYEKPDTNQESSTGGTFQPSAWMPGKKS